MRRAASAAVAVALATALAAPPVARAAAAPSAETARLDSVVAGFLPDRFAGAVRVERGGRLLLDRGYGLADRERRVPNASSTRFAIGSLTKQFTAAAILRLAEDGTLHTSDRITRWIPEASPAWDSVTIRQLLSHTAGIPDFVSLEDLGDTSGTPGERAVRRYGHQPLEFPPGSQYRYSSTGYLVLGRVIELASGMSYARFVTTRILEPLGLTDTGFESPGADTSRRARGYLARRGTATTPPFIPLVQIEAAGGLWSTTRDLLRWQEALLGGTLLQPASLTEMTTAVQGDYAYGIHHRTRGGREAFYHSGRVNGFESVLGYYPADSVAVVVLENLDTGEAANVFNQVVLASLPTARKASDRSR